jgi:glycine cleavage system H protein
MMQEAESMNYPQNLKYAQSHEWMLEEGDRVKVGISDFAQDALGDLVFVNLPEVGDTVDCGEPFADVESVKAVSDIYSPVSGEVVAVNTDLLDAPEAINGAPYDAWLVEVGNITDTSDLMDAAAYQTHCESENH